MGVYPESLFHIKEFGDWDEVSWAWETVLDWDGV
jgi:hypothetical protein